MVSGKYQEQGLCFISLYIPLNLQYIRKKLGRANFECFAEFGEYERSTKKSMVSQESKYPLIPNIISNIKRLV